MDYPFVSVIIPNYNHAAYLDERIQSVLNQTYQNFELIILDDCSPDNGASRDVIEKYRCNPHISHIIYNEINSGFTFKQWHKGMELAKGELIWIAESDDSCNEFLLEKLVGGFVRHNLVLAFCRSYIYDINGNKHFFPLQANLNRDIAISGREFITKYMIDRNSVANASSALFSREVALKLDCLYMKMRGEGDWLFWLELMRQGNIYFCSEPLNYFRFHENNSTKLLEARGVGAMEHKVIFDYLANICGKEIMLKERLNLVRHYLFFTQFESNKIKRKVLNLWDKSRRYRLYLAARSIALGFRILFKELI